LTTGRAREICELVQQLAGKPPGEEPTWELLFVVEILFGLLDTAEQTELVEHLTGRRDDEWRGVVLPEGAKLVGPLPRVCNQEQPHHS